MNTEDMIRELRNVEEKYKNKTYATGETNISLMCSEVADRLDLLRRENLQLSLSQYGMDKQVLEIVNEYIIEHLDKSDDIPYFEVYVVWKCKTLQNWKYLVSSDLRDGMYYEVTYNGNKDEFYLDAYKKFENKVIRHKF